MVRGQDVRDPGLSADVLRGRLRRVRFPEVKTSYGSILIPLLEQDGLRMLKGMWTEGIQDRVAVARGTLMDTPWTGHAVATGFATTGSDTENTMSSIPS